MYLKRFFGRILEFGHMIKFSHTIFAMPFALAGATLAAREVKISAGQVFWIILAMVAARSAAMGFNRLVDRRLDGENPRTNMRHLPSGRISKEESIIFIIFFSILFSFASFQLNLLCFFLSPLALFIVLLYSYTKRFTSLSHYVLGIALGLSPLGAWLAITGYFAWLPVILSLAVVFWVAGFDIIYACQDFDFDARKKLHSIPLRLGLRKALNVARLSHFAAFLLMGYLAWIGDLRLIYALGLVLIAGLLSYEHSLVHPENLEKLDMAFFNMNGIISIVFFASVLGDVVLA
jgi:4-hydroxybenzoate polyprenyltransferase